MTAPTGTSIPRLTATICMVAAGLVLASGAAAGHALPALAVALGMLIGAINAHLAERLVRAGVSFTLTSLARLVALTAVALAVGLLLGFARVYLVVAGLAAAQLVLAAVAFSARRQR